LKLRFQFTGGGTGDVDDRIDLDQITVTVTSGGTSTSTITMLDDGMHGDGAADDHVYGAQIPAQTVGTTVSYYLTATDSAGLSGSSPADAPGNNYSYVVVSATAIPAANFSATPTGGGAPLAVAFTDTSTGNITSRQWNFGDGTILDTSETTLPHVYGVPGTYSVTLTTSGPSGTSFTTRSGLVTATSVDTVGDGIPDWWRALYFGGDGKSTTADSAASGNPDHDGMDNHGEYLADTDPTDCLSWFHILGTSMDDGFKVYYQSSANRKYTLFSTSDLEAESWLAVPTQSRVSGSGGIDSLADPSPQGPRRFYRVGAQLP
jgi:PKD repeat protein